MSALMTFDSGAGDFSFFFWNGTPHKKSIQLERTQRFGASKPQYQALGYGSPIVMNTAINLYSTYSAQQNEIDLLLSMKGKNFTWTDFRGNTLSNLKLVDVTYNPEQAGDMTVGGESYDYCTEFTFTIEHIG